MQWKPLGFKENPFSTDPISQDTLALYTGHTEEIHFCQELLSQKDVLLIVEGARGVGTTSFANYLRYLFNALRDYIQTSGISWLMVGDVGL